MERSHTNTSVQAHSTQGDKIVLYQPDDTLAINVRVEDESVWLSQSQMADLFQATKQNISLHIKNIYNEGELVENATVKEYLTVQKEGNRNVKRLISFYNLDVIISVGYRVKSLRGTQFRQWANKILKEYLLRGYAVSGRRETQHSISWSLASSLHQSP